ncbi:hypothetical protein F7R91_20180 [Streptomyces luteolifulvus]|uniref:Uncharacterized protein n=1 Tax=Streptomyces luteolifulvus TaxID=2615112 RepID=A0A6H9UYW3_9ACTN|nr:hypothetical protein [Streptomyces luteolifulvus]KAB1144996.1 hypothetical protein F7R91_20180 [Streptomyces luteolifulvus]
MKPTAQLGTAALRPIEPEPGTLVHSSADRRLAAEHWLLSSLAEPGRGRQEWNTQGVVMLPLGTLFSAIRLPGRLVLAVTGAHSLPSREIDATLNDALGGGPVICDPRHQRYYVLVPASVPTSWRAAVDDWRVMDVDALGRGTVLGVPRLTRQEPHALASYWSVPMESMGELCTPLTVARFIGAGRHLMAEEQQ